MLVACGRHTPMKASGKQHPWLLLLTGVPHGWGVCRQEPAARRFEWSRTCKAAACHAGHLTQWLAGMALSVAASSADPRLSEMATACNLQPQPRARQRCPMSVTTGLCSACIALQHRAHHSEGGPVTPGLCNMGTTALCRATRL